jgi:transposase
MKQTRPRLEVNLPELYAVVEQARREPLSDPDYQKLIHALEALAGLAAPNRTTEKTKAVLPETDKTDSSGQKAAEKKARRSGHGRNGAAAFKGAEKVAVPHPELKAGDTCPRCETGKVYQQRKPKAIVKVTGQAPLKATVYEMERLRCNACGEVFTAPEPGNASPEKYDEKAVAMIALLKYGSGIPFYRLGKLEGNLGVPLPAATQWEEVEAAAEILKPAFEELIRQAAQGDVLHNDDTGMRVLRLAREPSDKRTGVFTSGIVATQDGRAIPLFFTGRQHAGENLGDVLKQRAKQLRPPIQMSDALSRNVPTLEAGMEIMIARCLAHGRRQFVEIADNFPSECGYVLQTLGRVYAFDADASERGLTPEERLAFHKQHSKPVMDKLQEWLKVQLSEKKAEPNSGLGKAIRYLLNHWQGLTAFLREVNAPLDNNLCERALKRAVLHRKNALFYKSLNGAQVGDLFMSLIHACELCGTNPFDYLTQLQKHAYELARKPAQWLPWNYCDALAAAGVC